MPQDVADSGNILRFPIASEDPKRFGLDPGPQVRPESFAKRYVSLHLKDFRRDALQSGQLNQAEPARFMIDEKVDIARNVRLVAGSGAEQCKMPDAERS
jgi:hypothetical protein